MGNIFGKHMYFQEFINFQKSFKSLQLGQKLLILKIVSKKPNVILFFITI